MSSPLNFHLEQYDGPLDLLLDLIRKQQIDIKDIPIATITQQYLEYMDKAREMLANFLKRYQPKFVPCDVKVLDGSKATSGAKTTDFYLGDLAKRHTMEWARLMKP